MTHSFSSLRVLFVEDNEADAFLLRRLLEEAGYTVESQRVQTAAGLEEALKTNAWDIVVSDYSLPQFDGLEALAQLKKTGHDIPFILVSGAAGEELAVQAMQAGAVDYVMKGNLARFVPAVQRELQQSHDRQRRRQVEGALAESEEVFRQLSESSPVGIFLADVNGHLIYVNPRWRAICGRSLMEAMGDGWGQALHPDDLEWVLKDWDNCVQAKREFYQECRILLPDGAVRWVEVRSAIRCSDKGEIIGFVGTVEDISRRKQAEMALRESETRFRNLFEHSPDAIFVEDVHGTVLDVNRAACQLHGLTREQLLGKNVTDLVPPDKRAEVAREFPQWFTGEITYHEGVSYTSDAHSIPVELRGTPIQYRGQPAVMFHVRDITKRKQLEAQLRQSQKMEGIGKLAGGIAHDFNNQLNAIIGFGELTLAKMDPSSSLFGHVSQMKKAGERAAALTRQLLAFSRKQIIEPKVLDLNTVVRDLHKMLSRLVREDIEIVLALSPAADRVKVDPVQIEQVITNLVVNARDAMPHGGALTITTGNVTLGDDPARPDVVPGHYVRLSIRDTGTGMTDEVKLRIFEPFFTTKPAGQGTGLGLATCYGAVKQSGGHIAVESEVGKGTTFHIDLPAVAGQDGGVAGEPDDGALPRGGETILLVEDEPAVRRVAELMLADLGYKVLVAADGEQALRLFRENVAVDLLITDVVMPKMNGKQLAEELRRLRPQLKVLFVSGYTDDAIVHHGVLDPGIAFLQKPFLSFVLARKVREILDKPKVTSS